MTIPWMLAALWVGLALLATLFAIWFRVSTALSEIVVGTVAQLVIGVFLTRFSNEAASYEIRDYPERQGTSSIVAQFECRSIFF
jgi:hypothetical protein